MAASAFDPSKNIRKLIAFFDVFRGDQKRTSEERNKLNPRTIKKH